MELRDRTVGVIGLGRIARETIRLLAAFGMRPPLACDPYVDPGLAHRSVYGWWISIPCSAVPTSCRCTAR